MAAGAIPPPQFFERRRRLGMMISAQLLAENGTVGDIRNTISDHPFDGRRA
jgi:hypothetical protein